MYLYACINTLENIYYKMSTTKVLKIKEFIAIKENFSHNLCMRELEKNIPTAKTEPLYENTVTTNQVYSAIIALPHCEVSIDSLIDTVTNYIKNQDVRDDCGFSVGNFFAGDYTSGKYKWSDKSLCVSLFGAISDRGGTIATAVKIMAAFNLPRILVADQMSLLEITRDGSEIKPLPNNRIKRLGD